MREHFEELVMMEKTKTQNEYGDVVNVWTEGITFGGTWLPAANTELIAAGKVGAQAVIHIDTEARHDIDFGDVIKRKKDGSTVKITTERYDFDAPPMAEAVSGLCYYLSERVTL